MFVNLCKYSNKQIKQILNPSIFKLNPTNGFYSCKLARFSTNKNDSFVKDTHTDSIMKPQYDFTKHSILKHLYMFLFNKDNIGNK